MPYRPLACFRTLDELDVDVRRILLHVDVEDAFVCGFRRFHAEEIAVDVQLRVA